MNEPLVSIIVPVFNVEHYIGECIDSIAKQTYRNIEIIIVDDGSTDNSLEICKTYASRDNRIKIVTKANEGVSIARNVGLDHANGDWIMFVDSDDWIETYSIKLLLDKLDSSKVDMIVANYYLNYDSHAKDMSQFSGKERSVVVSANNPQIYGCCIINTLFFNGLFPAELQFGTLLHYPVLKLYKRQIIKDHNLLFPVNLKQNEDKIFNIKYLRFANIIKYIPTSIYHYRIREGMASHGEPEKLYQQYLDAIYEWHNLSTDYKKNGISIDEYCQINTAMLCKALSSSLVNRINRVSNYKKACRQLKSFCCNAEVNSKIKYMKLDSIPKKTLKASIWLLQHRLYAVEIALSWILKQLKGNKE